MIIQILPARLPWRSAFCSPIIRPLRGFEMSCRANETLRQQRGCTPLIGGTASICRSRWSELSLPLIRVPSPVLSAVLVLSMIAVPSEALEMPRPLQGLQHCERYWASNVARPSG